MNIVYTTEKRGNTYVAVMQYEGRKKGEGTVFYSSSNRNFVVDWCKENSTQEQGEQECQQ